MNKAIARLPSHCFADGLTTATLGAPDHGLALDQHARYCEALSHAGLSVTVLPADESHPDATFVEDTAVLTARTAILTRPGAPSRRGEVAGIRHVLEGAFRSIREIVAPGTVEGGDICEADGHVLIGLSARTNGEGAQQLARYLSEDGFTSVFVDIRDIASLLHMKSGVTFLGDGRFLAVAGLAAHAALRGHEVIVVPPGEEYAANAVRVNRHVLFPAGFPRLEATVRALGYDVIALEMSEFQKMDGGLSCLSLRF